MKTKQFIWVVLFVSAATMAQTTTENYIKTTSFTKAFSRSTKHNATATDKIENITYFDGLGRPKQQIAIGQSPTGKDIVTPILYDAFGRQPKEHLPYVPGDTNNGTFRTGDQEAILQSYYSGLHPNDFTEGIAASNPFSEKVLEASPLNRVLEQAAPGTDWAVGNGHTIQFDYQTNSTEEVRLFEVALTDTYEPTLIETGFYNSGELYKTITKDENHDGTSTKNHTTEEFKDKQGRVVLKRTFADSTNDDGSVSLEVPHDTYYVYDDFGNLTYVLPPKAQDTEECTENYSAYFEQSDLTSTMLGGGGIQVSIVNQQIEIDFSMTFYRHQLNPNTILLDTNCHLPDMDLGSLTTPEPLSDLLNASIVDGHLIVEASYTAFITGISGSFTKTLAYDTETLDKNAYQYQYDHRNRLAQKKIPGKAWEYIIYDKLDRPVLTQDANLRANNQWLFTKYDVFGRVIYTGIYTHAETLNQSEMQAHYHSAPTNAYSARLPYEEKRTIEFASTYVSHYYSTMQFPYENIEILTVNYYDDYNFNTAGLSVPLNVLDISVTTRTKTLATGSKIKVLNPSPEALEGWITTITAYDEKARPIYTASHNAYLETTDICKNPTRLCWESGSKH